MREDQGRNVARGRLGGSTLRVRGLMALVGLLLADGYRTASAFQGQTPPRPANSSRAHMLATGTRTAQAAEFPLDSLQHYVVYVPPECVGTQRCPLVFFLDGASDFNAAWQRVRMTGDQLSAIGLMPTYRNGAQVHDSAVARVLHTFAIDPARIALIGRDAGATDALRWGGQHLNLFSQIMALSGGTRADAAFVAASTRTTEFLIDAGVDESEEAFALAAALRQAGHSVKHLVSLRDHGYQEEDFAVVREWLRASWAVPREPAAAPRKRPLPVLTVAFYTRLATFWHRFMAEPDSIRTAARRAHQREMVLPVGTTWASIMLTDFEALAARYPAVTADLAAAGLSAAEAERYRLAAISFRVGNAMDAAVRGPIAATSAQGKNQEFYRQHASRLQGDTLGGGGMQDMWRHP